jgi:DNA-binding NarL/FixJ family response regulator
MKPETCDVIRVLLVDDHAVVRAGTRQFLELDKNIQVVAEADNGIQATKLIDKFTPDVAVLDIQMPGMTGIEVTHWIRNHHPETGILILTAYDDDPYVLSALQAGANGYVMKTSPPEDVLQAVRDVCQGRSALAPAITQKLLSQITRTKNQPEVETLTDREMEVLRLVAHGYTNKAIGLQLDISDRTVQGHLAHIFTKMKAESRTEAVMRAVSLGWLPSAMK